MKGISGTAGIDPRVDVVFTWLFAEPAHEDLRIDFLNAVLGDAQPRITSARSMNPLHPASLVADRELRVDVEVTDEHGRVYQIEMQRQSRRGLHQRMLYGWARLYAGQVRDSSRYADLRPVVGIWICDEDAFPTSARAHLRFRVSEAEEHVLHHPDLRIDVIQLRRVAAHGAGLADERLGRWCRFFNEAAHWRTIPVEVYSPVLEHAMKAIDTFRTDPERKALYQARINYQLERSAELEELADAKAEVEQARAEVDQARAEVDQARAEVDQARAEADQARAKAGLAEAVLEAERSAKEAALAQAAAAQAEIDSLRAKLAERQS